MVVVHRNRFAKLAVDAYGHPMRCQGGFFFVVVRPKRSQSSAYVFLLNFILHFIVNALLHTPIYVCLAFQLVFFLHFSHSTYHIFVYL